MNIYKLAIFIFILIAYSCKKDDHASTVISNNKTYTQYGTPFSNVPATDDIVMYEVNLRAISAVGNLQGVINRLDEIKKLGVNVIWLMPIYPIGKLNSVNSPYCVKDYKAVNTEFGTLSDLRKLTDLAHAKNMAVVLDWIANHTSWDNAWIKNKSWYTQDGNGNIISPAGMGWPDVADLNFVNQDMRKAMIDAMKYWVLEANVDGYRCDYADGVPFDFWKQAIDSITSIQGRKFILLAEGSRANHYTAGFDLTYSWNFYTVMKNVFNGQPASNLYAVQDNEYSTIPSGKHKLRFTTNHDESAWNNTPMVYFNGKEGALAASAVTIFMGGVPLIYSGQEVGTIDLVPFFTKSTIKWNDNPDMLLVYQTMLSFYSQSDVSRKGTLTDYSNTDIVCFTKSLSNQKITLIANMRNAQVNFSLPVVLQNTNWTNIFTNSTLTLTESIQLNKYQYIILKNI